MNAIAPSFRRNLLFQVLVLVTLTPGLILNPVPVRANPQGANVVAGNVNFQGMGSARLDINNLSQRAIINWQSFSIQKGEITNINQGRNAFTMNRVVSGNPTAIYGTLRAANGGVAVINPNGIVVHEGGAVDVAGMLTMSTLDISDRDFLNGGRDRYRGNTSAGVVNYGAVSSSGGDVVLLGNFLQNSGTVSAPAGTVAFGAGGDIIVDNAGGAKISVQAGGKGGAVGIENTGEINAAAAELKAHGNVYALAIKNDGLVRASGYNFSGGRLTLSAGSQGRIVNTGNLQARNSDGSGGQIQISGGDVELGSSGAGRGQVDASGAAGMAGGNVQVSGTNVALAQGASVNVGGSSGGNATISGTGMTVVNGNIDAVGSVGAGGNVTVEGSNIAVGSTAAISSTGQNGAGNVLVGGGFQGKDANVRNARTLRVDDGAHIAADSIDSGRGGNIILWSDVDTVFAGAISATGVTRGGFVEISGKDTLSVTGDVDLSSTSGVGGDLLLDPTNITISAIGDPGIGGSTISNVWLSNQLDAGNNVIISTNFGGSERGNIVVGRTGSSAESLADKVEWYQDSASIVGGSLSLLATGDIAFNTSVRTASAGNINIVAGWDGATGLSMGNFDISAVLATMNDGNVGNDAAGLNGGSVFVGGNGSRVGLNVGSRWGDTSVAARDLFVTGSTATTQAYAQLGFYDNGVEYDLSNSHNGARMNEWWGATVGNVLGKNYIALLGGTEFGTGDTLALGTKAFRGAGWGATGDITIGLSGRLDMRSGTGASHTQIGHGGSLREGTENKWSSTAGNPLNPARVSRDGIQIDPGDNRYSFWGSTWRTNYAGDAARIDGDIKLTADGDILMMAARGFDAEDNLVTNVDDGVYTMIGHGGAENHGSYHGDIQVQANGVTPIGYVRGPSGLGIQVLGGRGTRAFAMIGHGSGYEGNRRSIWDQRKSGDISVTATTGAIRLQAHNQAIREGDLNFGTIVGPNTPTPINNGSDSSNLTSFVQIGHGGVSRALHAAGGTFIMPGGTNVNNIVPDASMTGDINVSSAGTYVDLTNAEGPIGLLLRAGNRNTFLAMIGHGGTNHNAVNAAVQTPNFGGAAVLPFGVVPVAASTGYNGNISVEAKTGSIVATGGDDFRSDRVWGYGLNFARIGHGGDTVRGNKGGTINVSAGQGAGALSGDILFTAGKQFRSHAQIGHGGWDSDGNILGGANSADINVTAQGTISFVSPPSGTKDALGLSTDYAYWWFANASPTGAPQTGQPGFWQTEDRFVMLGHGGYASTLVMPNRQDITVTSGTGDLANADRRADTGGINFISGDMERDFAQLGHGGHSSGANNPDGYTGNINVTANGGGLNFDGSVFGAQGIVRATNISLNGTDLATTNGTAAPVVVTRGNGGGFEAYVQLGHGGYANRGVHSGDITVNAWGGIDFLAAPVAPAISRTGNTTIIQSALGAGTGVWVPLVALRTTAFPSTVVSTLNYQTPEVISNVIPGTVMITLSDGRRIIDVPRTDADDRTSAPLGGTPTAVVPQASAGLFLVNADGSNPVKVGEINYTNAIVSFRLGGQTAASNTSTGIDPVAAPVNLGGATVTNTAFQTAQGLKERAYAQLGHGGYESEGPNNKANNLPSMSGNIDINAGGDIRFQAGAWHRGYAQLGHGGWDVKGIKSGDISIDHVDATHLVGGLRFTSGSSAHRQFDYQAYAQLGHGGYDSDGNSFGNITVRGTEDRDGMGVLVKAGDTVSSYAQIGHGGRESRSGTGDGANSFGLNGNIDIQVSGDIAVVAGTLKRNNVAWTEDGVLYAQIGHGGMNADPSNNDNANVAQVGANTAVAGVDGAGTGHWGHFGDISLVSTNGNISFMGGNNTPIASRVDFSGNPLGLPADPNGFLTSNGTGYGRLHFAQLGHGGLNTGGNHFGNITVRAENGGVNVVGGALTTDNDADRWNYAHIGNNAANTPGNVGKADGFIKVHALGSNGDVNVVSGNSLRSTAQIGTGGSNSAGDKLGTISVIAGRNLNLQSGVGNLNNNYGKVGHGDVRNGGGGFWDGDIMVSVGNTLNMGRAIIGHIDYKFSAGYIGGLTSGDTYIAVSRNNPNASGTGQFITTADSVLSSSSGGVLGDELRLYMPSAGVNRIAAGTYLNNTPYVRTPAPGSNRADEQFAVEHQFPASGLTEADAVFTPEGDYPTQPFGLYNIYYGGLTPPVPPTPPTPPVPPVPPLPPFDFNPFVFSDTYDAFFRSEELFLYDGYDEVLPSMAYEDAMESDAPPALGASFLEELLDDSFGERQYGDLEPGSTILADEDDEELERRKRRASQKVGKGGLSYYVYDPGTNRYSSYRVFGVEQTRLSVTQ
ncbi:MAG: filamentous hemagglutinin N-terminal domain-containing protein [Verrucomicrobiales bacterium]|nr:filamentous hemagglutinin N-terminal domain-containing protein [Verrucomicrobiales bacterium]